MNKLSQSDCMYVLLFCDSCDFLIWLFVIHTQICVLDYCLDFGLDVEFVSGLNQTLDKRELLQVSIGLFVQNYMRNSCPVIGSVIDSCIISIFVCHLLDDTDSGIGHFKQRCKDGSIICVVIKGSIWIGKV